MNRLYTDSDYKRILIDIVTNGYKIFEEQRKARASYPRDVSNASEEDMQYLKMCHLANLLIVHLLHPAHELSKEILKDKQDLIDQSIREQKFNWEKGLLSPCFCSVCKDEIKSE